jgi:hypothetical protein
MPVVPFKGPHPFGEGVRVHFGKVVAPPNWGKRASVDGPTTSSDPLARKRPSKR